MAKALPLVAYTDLERQVEALERAGYAYFPAVINSEEISAEYDFLNRKRRQDVQNSEKKYFENGSVYIFSREHFESTNNRAL